MKKYPIAFSYQTGEFTASELKNKKLSGCDAIIIHAIGHDRGERGEGYFTQILTANAGGKKLDADEIFFSMLSLAKALAQDERLTPYKRSFCQKISLPLEQAMALPRTEKTQS